MALLLKPVEAARGWRWIAEAFRLFARRPLAFTSLFVLFLFAALFSTLIPLIGGLLQMMALPLLSLGFMIASRAARNDLPVNPGQFIEPLRAERSRRNTLLSLCAAYALGTVLIMGLSEWIDGGAFDRLQVLMSKGDEARPEMEALLADPRLPWGLITRFGLAACLSVPFWHAPALVYWQGQSVGQALFSSTLAMWRCKGAFTMYSLAWVVVIGIFGAIVGLLFALFDARQLAGVIAMPADLAFSTVFYVSLLFTYEGCFSQPNVPRPLPQ